MSESPLSGFIEISAFILVYCSCSTSIRLAKNLYLKVILKNGSHNSPIYDECQTHSAWVLTLPWEWAHQDDSNDTPQPIGEFQFDFPLLWIKAYPGLS